MEAQGGLSSQIGRQVFEPLYFASRTYRLDRLEARYLDLSLRGPNISSRGAQAIVQSAIEKWPIGYSNCGALAFAQDRTLIFALAREVDIRGGVHLLESAQASRQLSVEVKEYVSLYLRERASRKKGGWPFRLW